jgi:hypothetical protein
MATEKAVISFDRASVTVSISSDALIVDHREGQTRIAGHGSKYSLTLDDDQVRTLALGLGLIVDRMDDDDRNADGLPCPSCATSMEARAWWSISSGRVALWVCPNCGHREPGPVSLQVIPRGDKQ